jgi:5-methylcytosine-specific restriction endonuclease McrA
MPRPGKPINRRGPRTREWEKVRRSLKCEFTAKGITTCELRLPGCRFDDQLSFAHRVKRRFINTEEELRNVILVCIPCHNVMELQGHAKMARIFDSVIAKRTE